MKLRITRPRLRTIPVHLPGPGGSRPLAAEWIVLRLEVEVYDRPWAGHAAFTLAPGWIQRGPRPLTKDASRRHFDALEAACRLSLGLRVTSAFDFSRQFGDALRDWAARAAQPALLAGWAAALFELALLDAVGRRVDRPILSLLLDTRENPLGWDIAAIHPELAGRSTSEFVPLRPYQTQQVRLSIPPSLPLSPADVPPAARTHATGPTCLEDALRDWGIRHLSLQVAGTGNADIARIAAAADLLQRHAPGDHTWSLDLAEAAASTSDLFSLWTDLRSHPRLDAFLRRLSFLQQPFPRDLTLSPPVIRFFRGWPAAVPVVIDVANDRPGALRAALDAGYAGCVHRPVQGFFHGLADACLLRARREAGGRRWAFATSDHLALGPVGWPQAVGLPALLGEETSTHEGLLAHPSLADFPEAFADLALHTLPDLYTRAATPAPDPAGTPNPFDTIGHSGAVIPQVRQGRLRLGTATRTPLGAPAVLGDWVFGEGESSPTSWG